MEMEPVICPAIIFSDSAIREQGTGKLSIIGSFTHFNAPSTPFLSPLFLVTVLLSNIHGPIDRLPVTLRIETPGTGHVLASVSGELKIEPNITKNEVLEIVFPVGPTPFPQVGSYEIHILVGSESVGKRALFVRSISTNPQL